MSMSVHAAARAVYVLGAGGHGRVIAEAARALGVRVLAFLDEDPGSHGQEINGTRVLGGFDLLEELEPDAAVALGIGSNHARKRIAAEMRRQDRVVRGFVHPSAVISAHADIGEGTYVGPLAVVHVNASVGRHSIVNTGAIVDHECRLSDFAHASANVILGGGSSVGEGSLIGVGASVLPNVSIGAWTEVGAGAVVTRNLDDFVVAYGVPARVRRRLGGA